MHLFYTMPNLLQGKLVRLAAYDPDRAGELYAAWYRDSEFSRMYDLPVVRVRNAKQTQDKLRKELEENKAPGARFLVQTLSDGQTIGEAELAINPPALDEGFVSIGIGAREFWSKGYGTDAMQLLVAYAFLEWNVRRVALDVFSYNPRAIRSYEKVGFRREGACRKLLQRGGERFDMIYMGLLRREWETLQNG
jgi:RimJ/RimL family protein N-acetyltransferase